MAIKSAISGEVLEHIGRLVAEGWTVTDACRVTRKQLGLDIGDRHLWNTYYQLRAAGAWRRRLSGGFRGDDISRAVGVLPAQAPSPTATP